MTRTSGEKPSRSRGTQYTAAAAVAISLGIAAVALGLRGKPDAAPPASADTTVTAIAGGPFEPSGVASVPGSNLLLFVDDGRPSEILMMELAPDGTQAGAIIPIPLGAEVRDLEGITTDGSQFYVVGSQSKKNGFEGDGLVRFTFDVKSRRVNGVERIQGLKAWLAANVPELLGTERQIGDHVLNIEGLAWDPAKRRLLLGLRAPQAGGEALIIPVTLADANGPFSRENLRFDGPTIRVNLGGAGIRSLEYDASAKAFQLIAGAGLDTEGDDFRVFEWSGEPGAPLRHVATFSRELKPEGFTRAMVGGRPASVIVFDVGRFSVIY